MNKRKKLKYQENLEKMGVEYLSELANNGQIYVINTKEQVTDLLDACKIEGISSRGYQTPPIYQTELPIFFTVVTYDYHAFFLLHSHDYYAVWLEVNSVLKAALHRIERLRANEAQIKEILNKHPENDIAYTFPQNMLGYVHEEEPPAVIPYPEDFPVVD
jgi:hypothetical protein